ncbi:hypothetical protein LMA04_00640 [Pseudescherichia vulneris]|uniref:hypothetical protein n=1 Tax=Pseudescherichia vulneris TaxID=566 RepID=UPI00227C75BE|nr:hypothetical protein [Pseudescherichia vulneris]WAH52602.1 hypothetical protein LMA04_00640 [Pseudescherichia vulneris]
MSKLTVSIAVQKKWWCSPLLSVMRVLIYAGIIRSEKRVSSCASFIADHGFNFKVEK